MRAQAQPSPQRAVCDVVGRGRSQGGACPLRLLLYLCNKVPPQLRMGKG